MFKIFLTKTRFNTTFKNTCRWKPYTCIYCNKSFSHNFGWKIHLMTHTGERPFSCTECIKTFRCNGALSRYLRNHMQQMFKIILRERYLEHAHEDTYIWKTIFMFYLLQIFHKFWIFKDTHEDTYWGQTICLPSLPKIMDTKL